jgi:hypothetical protein
MEMESAWATDVRHGWAATTQPLSTHLVVADVPVRHLERLARQLGGQFSEWDGVWRLEFRPQSLLVREHPAASCTRLWVRPVVGGYATMATLGEGGRTQNRVSECRDLPQLFHAVYVSLVPACEWEEANTPWACAAELAAPPPDLAAPWED